MFKKFKTYGIRIQILKYHSKSGYVIIVSDPDPEFNLISAFLTLLFIFYKTVTYSAVLYFHFQKQNGIHSKQRKTHSNLSTIAPTSSICRRTNVLPSPS